MVRQVWINDRYRQGDGLLGKDVISRSSTDLARLERLGRFPSLQGIDVAEDEAMDECPAQNRTMLRPSLTANNPLVNSFVKAQLRGVELDFGGFD
jgi:hypothetical protein